MHVEENLYLDEYHQKKNSTYEFIITMLLNDNTVEDYNIQQKIKYYFSLFCFLHLAFFSDDLMESEEMIN